jgi:hypothetical protein
MRDSACDRYSNNTAAQIVAAEKQYLKKSVGHVSELCSFLTAHRLLDIIYRLEHPEDGLSAPTHQRLPCDFSTFKVTKFTSPFASSFTIFPGL